MRILSHTNTPLVACLILLQGVDFLLTWILLGRADVYEANPLAREILDNAGWGGLALFKALITLLALGAALGVASRRPQVGLRLLVVMCLVMLGVNLYSGTLLARPLAVDPEHARETRREDARVASLEVLREFMEQRRAICADWSNGRISLPEGIERMTAALKDVNTRLLTEHHWIPKPGQRDQTAAFLYTNAVSRMQRVAETEYRVEMMWRELNEKYPEAAQEVFARTPKVVPRSCVPNPYGATP